MNRVKELFKIKYPIIQGGMIWCSGWRLVSAVSNNGVDLIQKYWYINQTLLVVFTSCISAFEYKSSHDQTYWFPANDHSLNGYHIGTVRSNLEWNDEMNFYVQVSHKIN